MFQRFHLFLASLVMSQKNIQLEWFGRGNIDDIETVLHGSITGIPVSITWKYYRNTIKYYRNTSKYYMEVLQEYQ